MEYARPQMSNSLEIEPHGYDAMAYGKAQNKSGKLTAYLDILYGLLIFLAVGAAFTALATWSVNDPSFSNANGKIATNWLGFWGASFADITIQFLGLGAALSLFPPAIISWLKISRYIWRN